MGIMEVIHERTVTRARLKVKTDLYPGSFWQEVEEKYGKNYCIVDNFREDDGWGVIVIDVISRGVDNGKA